MKDDDVLPVSTPTAHILAPATSSSSSSISRKDNTSINSSIFGRGRYKFWALAAILLLAFWSMLTGTVTLRWSAGNLNRFSDDFATPIHDDLDVLEMEEREKVVKHMWDVYTNSRRIRIPRFWQEAFEAAYEELTSDVVEVREAAISEIANMSMHSIHLETPPLLKMDMKALNLNEFMFADRRSWRHRIRVVDSFLGSGSVVEGLRVGLSRLALN